MDFVSFGKIPRLEMNSLWMTITQKLHGTNAQIYIQDNEIKAGSRNRWLTVGDDNYGFAFFVESNKEELIAKLGNGRHFGEWCGPGINNGEGLSEKKFLLFNHWRWEGKYLPEQVGTIPKLYHGMVLNSAIERIMDELRSEGSQLVLGFMNPEGIVIQIGECFYKKVFSPEDTKWTGQKKIPKVREIIDVSHLLQPIRLEKLLSRDENYLRDFPKSLVNISRDYVKDLIDEKQFDNEDEVIRKAVGKCAFPFIRDIVNEKLYGSSQVA